MLLDKKCKIKWSTMNKKYYVDLGYKFTKFKDEFEVPFEHIMKGSEPKLKIKCDFCGKIVETKCWVAINNKKNNKKDCCKKCKGKKTGETLIKLYSRNGNSIGDKYSYLIPEWSEKNKLSIFDYGFGSGKIVWWKCNNGHEWQARINCRTSRGDGCPYCSGSAGENKILEILEKSKVKFKSQFSFPDLKSDKNYKLRFDFAVFDNKNNLKFLIEYDGSQHYHSNFGEDILAYNKEKDKLKNNYCNKNNIYLLRIPYWDFFNIENILLHMLNKEE
jgi:hypothetical protein